MYSSSHTSTAVKMKWLVFVFSAVGFFLKKHRQSLELL